MHSPRCLKSKSDTRDLSCQFRSKLLQQDISYGRESFFGWVRQDFPHVFPTTSFVSPFCTEVVVGD